MASLAVEYDIINTIENMYDAEWRSEIATSDGYLDPVEVAQSLRLSEISKHVTGPSPIATALDILSTTDLRKYLVNRTTNPPRYRPTRREFKRFQKDLMDAGLTTLSNRKVKGYAKFFTVLKKIDATGTPVLRTIIDAFDANDNFTDPPPVNLPTLIQLLDAFQRVQRMKAMDLRHWFHQVGLSQELSGWFCYVVDKLRVQWKSLPMGWKWAPFIAQALAWYLIVGDEVFQWKELPRTWTDGKVVVALWYDNVIAGGGDDDLEQFWNGIKTRMSQVGAVMKEESDSKDTGSIQALGLEWSPSVELGLRWSLLEKFRSKLKLAADHIEENHSLPLKALAGAVGSSVWALWATRQPLFALQPVYAQLTADVKTYGWKAAVSTNGYRRILPLLRDLATFKVFNSPISSGTRYCSCDASLEGWAGVDWASGMVACGPWRETYRHTDIFFLEAIGSKRTVEKFISPGLHLFQATDNKGLYHAIRKQSTKCPRTAVVLRQLFNVLQDNNATLTTGFIRSEDNPSDEPSRGLPLNQQKLALAPQLVQWTVPTEPLRG